MARRPGQRMRRPGEGRPGPSDNEGHRPTSWSFPPLVSCASRSPRVLPTAGLLIDGSDESPPPVPALDAVARENATKSTGPRHRREGPLVTPPERHAPRADLARRCRPPVVSADDWAAHRDHDRRRPSAKKGRAPSKRGRQPAQVRGADTTTGRRAARGRRAAPGVAHERAARPAGCRSRRGSPAPALSHEDHPAVGTGCSRRRRGSRPRRGRRQREHRADDEGAAHGSTPAYPAAMSARRHCVRARVAGAPVRRLV